jgi:predicted helicase
MAKIYYYRTEEFWRKEQKYEFLDKKKSYKNIQWTEIKPNKKHNWLNKGIREDFEDFIPIGTKKAKRAKRGEAKTIFKIFANGVNTARDSFVYDFDKDKLLSRIEELCKDYNAEILRYQQQGSPKNIDNFVDYGKIKWSSTLKRHLKSGQNAEFDSQKIRKSLYRPFTKMFLYYDRILIDRPSHFDEIFPTAETENDNRVICVKAPGSKKPFHCLMTDKIADLHLTGDSQCFPFYVYDDAGNATENITDWCLEQFRDHYGVGVDLCVNPNNTKGEHTGSPLREITKWDIFYYVYALLHHPFYRKRYAANLKRELPRIPFASNFFEFAEIGQKLAALHIGYEDAEEYPLDMIENPDEPLDWRVEKMRIRNKPKKYSRRKSRKKGKSQKPSKPAHIIYNDFLTLGGIPPETFDYRLGNRSALEWIVDRYRIKTDKRSGITNDPNRDDDPQYIVRLIKKIVTVSLETVELVEMLAEFNIEEGETTK